MDTAIVTGADRGTGLQTARELVALGFRVYGLAADFSACQWDHHDFRPVSCDLSSAEHLRRAWEHIEAHDPQVNIVVHAAPPPVLRDGFEASAWEDIAYCVNAGLMAPLLLTRWALPSLVRYRGYVITIGWNGHGSCPRGAAAAAAEGGLYHWSQSLFDELRDTGVKVCTLYPQPNLTAADPKARVRVEPQSEIEAKLVARAVTQVLQFKHNNLLSELVVRPQATREEPRIAANAEPLLQGPKDIVLPDPDKRPPAPEPIATPERRRPDDAWEFDDEDEDDDWDGEDDEEEDDELDALMESSRRILREQNEAARRQLERTRQKAQSRPERTERPERSGNAERKDGKDRNGRNGRNDRNERSDRSGRDDRSVQDNRGSQRGEGSEGKKPDERPARDNREGRQDENRQERHRDERRRDEPRRDELRGRNREEATASPAAQAADLKDDVRQTARQSEPEGSDSVAQRQPAQQHAAAGTPSGESGDEGKRRRRRRRGGRGRNRNREGGSTGAERENQAAQPSSSPRGQLPVAKTERAEASSYISPTLPVSAPVADKAKPSSDAAAVKQSPAQSASAAANKRDAATAAAAPVKKAAKKAARKAAVKDDAKPVKAKAVAKSDSDKSKALTEPAKTSSQASATAGGKSTKASSSAGTVGSGTAAAATPAGKTAPSATGKAAKAAKTVVAKKEAPADKPTAPARKSAAKKVARKTATKKAAKRKPAAGDESGVS